MRSIAAGMSPAKIAIAVAVTIAPSAGTGDMKKVTGTRSAVAIVAVRPGIAPTNMPKAADAKITQMTKGSKTRPSAVTKASMAASYRIGSSQPRGSGTRIRFEKKYWIRIVVASATGSATIQRTPKRRNSAARITKAQRMKPTVSEARM